MRRVAIFLFMTGCLWGQTLVQQSAGGGCGWTTGTSFTCSVSGTPSSSNVLVLVAGSSNASVTISTGTPPSQTNVTWTKKVSSAVNIDTEIWCGTPSGTPGTSVSITLSGTPSAFFGNLSEWSGTKACANSDAGATASNHGPSGNPSTATVTPTASSGGMVLWAVGRHGGTFSSGPTNSFTALNSGSTLYMFAYRIVASISGTYSTGWTLTGGSVWEAQIFGIADSGAAPSSTQGYIIVQ